MPLSDINILLLLENASSRKSSQVFEVIRQNLTNSERINDVKSKAIQDKNYSSAEFHKILQDMEIFCKLKEEIQRETKQT